MSQMKIIVLPHPVRMVEPVLMIMAATHVSAQSNGLEKIVQVITVIKFKMLPTWPEKIYPCEKSSGKFTRVKSLVGNQAINSLW